MSETTIGLASAARRPRWNAAGLEGTRESLLARLKEADQDGWQRFFEIYGGVIHALALKAGLNSSEADDVLQETLISVASEMPDFRYDRSRGSFKGWLFRITRRRVADQFRKRVRLQRQTSEFSTEMDEVADPSDDSLEAIWEEEWRMHLLQIAITSAKKKVSPGQWQIFDLATLQGWPTGKITTLLGVNRARVYMAKLRVGRILRAEVQTLKSDSTTDSGPR
jgi:RNA polymerase sigma factor (sigma-70 family)